MWVLVPTDEILFFARTSRMDIVNVENAGAFLHKEKYPKEIRPMPFASCALAVLSGFAGRDFVPPAKFTTFGGLRRAQNPYNTEKLPICAANPSYIFTTYAYAR
jgi:hypothetical protein